MKELNHFVFGKGLSTSVKRHSENPEVQVEVKPPLIRSYFYKI